MADLISAALTRIGYAEKKLKADEPVAAADHLAKARTFLVREQNNIAVAEDADVTADVDWSRSIGVLDELGGDDFFGALVPGANQ